MSSSDPIREAFVAQYGELEPSWFAERHADFTAGWNAALDAAAAELRGLAVLYSSDGAAVCADAVQSLKGQP